MYGPTPIGHWLKSVPRMLIPKHSWPAHMDIADFNESGESSQGQR
jgi:hypothetical protein